MVTCQYVEWNDLKDDRRIEQKNMTWLSKWSRIYRFEGFEKKKKLLKILKCQKAKAENSLKIQILKIIEIGEYKCKNSKENKY